MADSLDVKRIKLELVRVAAARAELEFRIDEKMEEIERLRLNIQIQADKEAELNEKIKSMK